MTSCEVNSFHNYFKISKKNRDIWVNLLKLLNNTKWIIKPYNYLQFMSIMDVKLDINLV